MTSRAPTAQATRACTLDRPTSGDVWIADTKITALKDRQLTRLRREHIGFIFQFFNLLAMLSAEENILLPISIAEGNPIRRGSPS
jgi:putative ABC transport system ATP-binding protein